MHSLYRACEKFVLAESRPTPGPADGSPLSRYIDEQGGIVQLVKPEPSGSITGGRR